MRHLPLNILVVYAYFLLLLLPAATWVEDQKRHRRPRQQRQQSVFTELRVSVPLGKRMLLGEKIVGSESVGICACRLRAQTSNLKNPEVILRREEMGKSGTAISWFDQERCLRLPKCK